MIIVANKGSLLANIITSVNVTQYYPITISDQTFKQFGTQNGRAFFGDRTNGSNKTAVVWSEFNFQMAWIVIIDNAISFLSNSDVQDPCTAKNWKYLDSESKVIDASNFHIDSVGIGE